MLADEWSRDFHSANYGVDICIKYSYIFSFNSECLIEYKKDLFAFSFLRKDNILPVFLFYKTYLNHEPLNRTVALYIRF